MSTQTVSQAKVASESQLYISFELGDKKWKLTASDGHRAPSRYNVDAGDTATVAYCIAKARNRCKLGPQARVHCCYEAGRDGWWLHRWLREQGADNIVVDACSIEVNRRARSPRPIAWTATSCYRCCCATMPGSVSGRCCMNPHPRTKTRDGCIASWCG